ncbi:hypothetical protein VMCG_04080 [Cytospora schulzeri]|uniref:DUF7709 domain-containing protein n=1 Tax=Cytospora schulzeri TaxID=448051 RepID=A0A423WTT6_9PEZI|nr:hypothetical protein VMCG_04080 [Valsa malicola]
MTDPKLAELNSSTMGVQMPEIKLADGSTVQTGTVGALLLNTRAYNKAHAEGDEATMAELREIMKIPLSLLDRVGLFELFTPEEWINDGGKNEGRRVVGKLFLEYKEAKENSNMSKE